MDVLNRFEMTKDMQDKAFTTEWLEINGSGAYASSTVVGCHTRKYHGWLVVPDDSAKELLVLLSKVEAELKVGEQTLPLSTHAYPGVLHPQGYAFQTSFDQEAGVRCHYQSPSGEIVVAWSLMLLPNKPTVVLRYQLLQAPQPALLTLKPLLAFRNRHHLTHQNEAFDQNIVRKDNYWLLFRFAGAVLQYQQRC